MSEWILKEILFKIGVFDKMFQKNSKRIPKNFKRIPKEFQKNSKIWFMEWLEKHLRYLSDFFSAIVKCIWKKNIRKKCWFDHSSPYKKQPPYKKENGKKSLQCLWPPKLSLHQINLTFFFSFHIFIFSHSR